MAESMNDIMHPNRTRDPSFPHAPEGWSQEGAQAVAAAEGLVLGEEHWSVVRALQEYFARNSAANIRALHDALEESFHSRGGLKFLYTIFPAGPVAQGCRLAGLEAPAGSTDLSFGSVQ